MPEIPKGRVLNLTKGSPAGLLLRFCLPLFLGNLLQQCYNLADLSIAGHILGDGALAKIGATSALYSLITNFAFGLNNGLALTVSKRFGAGDKEGLKDAVCWMVIWAALTAGVLTAGFLALQRPLLFLLQVPGDILSGATSYLTVILAGIPLTMAYNLEASLLQAVGNSTTPLLLLLFSSVLNIGLDIWFMGPLSMGVAGAAIATVLAQGISAVLGFLYIARNYPWLRFGRRNLQVPKAFALGTLGTGLSMALMNAIYNIGSVILQGSINALGQVTITAQVGGRKLIELICVPGIALGNGVATYSSQNAGAGKGRRIARGMWAGVLLYMAWWAVALVLAFGFGRPLVGLVTGSGDRQVLENAVLYLRVSVGCMPPMILLVIFRNVLQGLGRPLMPLLCSVLELLGKAVFALFLVPLWGYRAVCACEPVTWVVCAVVIALSLYHHRDKLRDSWKEHHTENNALRKENPLC